MRIVGGTHRGLKLADLGAGDVAAHLRPTSDRVREAMFNLLINGAHAVPLDGARVLDLFAGTGALGLEALSRGAVFACFIDDGVPARALLRENIEKMRAMGRTKIFRRNATDLGTNHGAGFDLVFMDPPYGKALGERALASSVAGGWLTPGARVVWEENAPQLAPAGFKLIDQRRYGETHVTMLEHTP